MRERLVLYEGGEKMENVKWLRRKPLINRSHLTVNSAFSIEAFYILHSSFYILHFTFLHFHSLLFPKHYQIVTDYIIKKKSL
jgi:hypothetical protein